ncbi:type I glyceraldehyde-3-phosphate dehydrogenase [Candidatus Roizmanbacteria bacterium RIFCSPHIGHO2_01_FULL_35_10]|uniref:Type I glyceraldehyde-3-phosphate dehydrogenase n=1 Tax=Candidatus Roizmanbacteria bacterium RIFCSPLOWO2_01_FULL_35_13 TaxID=1802055 RepID=A0A1F7IA75_9BACT|nr:MAG: type I glyceraldehyde-3-phosphate dehydrogenase [Candidatus Roizmanbacteria bacterium RIFCSPHIGHO2_01_FULL_35_10]OGK40256.1 MAG: type I glyceraldehyde-3-phosphate dehydrogenase [Candidatus Roizmanbacteria bacterium RIFCSPLOWO2_01_FULL_35_13]
MKRLKIGLNGFGRIGRAFTRIALKRKSFDLSVINTRKSSNKMMAYLLQYDSVYRKFEMNVKEESDGISVNGNKISTNLGDDPSQIPWEEYGVDVVVDATGAFETSEDLKKHVRGTVKKVILTAPSKPARNATHSVAGGDDEMPHIVLGVNDDIVDFKGNSVISNCSCTTNSASPLFKVLDDNCKIVSGFLTTSHAYTQTQPLLDDTGKSPDRSRAAGLNIVPTTTGAAKAVAKTLPQLAGKIDGMAIRVPVPTVSFSDVSAAVEKSTTVEEVNQKFKEASENSMKGILSYETEILVSSDYIGSPYSCIFDANYTKVINGNFVKVFGWYDNEWGYSNRLVDLVEKLTNYI